MTREHLRPGRAAGAVLRLAAALTLAAATFATSSPSPAAAAVTAQQYRLIDLGALDPYTYGEASGVSGGGIVVGTYSDSVGSTAFSYFRGSKTFLSAPDEFMFTHAVGISAANRWIAGYACAAEDQCRVVQWSGSGAALRDYGTLPGGTEAYPVAVNSSGHMVGWGAVGGPLDHAFFTLGDPYYSIVDLNYYVGGSGWTLERAADINEAGDIVGSAMVSGQQRGFLLKAGYSSANLVDLGYRAPSAVNDAGHVAGRDHATDGAFWFDGTSYHTIPALPAYSTTIVGDMNNRDEVVGFSYSASASRGFLYRDGTTYDLNSLLAPTSWTVETATSINDGGEIAGWASKNGVTHPVLLVPTWSVASTYGTVSPTRVLDTRVNLGLSGSFQGGVARRIQLNKGVLPAEATAITANLTVAGATAAGYIAAGPNVYLATTSLLNLIAGEDRANGITVQLAPDGTLQLLYGAPSTARVHLILDVTGYFTPDQGGYHYVTLTPTRVLDTRTPVHQPIRAGTPGFIQLKGNPAFNLPSTAVAVTGNVTITSPAHAGWLAVSTSSAPATSTVNFRAGETKANNVTVKLTGNGVYAVYGGAPAGSSIDVIFDLTGYFVPGAGLEFVPVPPIRVVDTRSGLGISSKLVSGTPRTVSPATSVVPFAAKALVGNATVVGPTSAGYIVVGPLVTIPSPTSTVNYVAGDVRANGTTFRLGHNSTRCTFQAAIRGASSAATSQFVFDVMGYYR